MDGSNVGCRIQDLHPFLLASRPSSSSFLHTATRPKALCYQVLPFLPTYVSHLIRALIIHISIRVTAACSRSSRLFPSASFQFNSAGCRMQGSNIKNTIQAFLASATVLLILPQHRKSFHFLLNGIVEYKPNARDHYPNEPKNHLPCQARKTLAKPSQARYLFSIASKHHTSQARTHLQAQTSSAKPSHPSLSPLPLASPSSPSLSFPLLFFSLSLHLHSCSILLAKDKSRCHPASARHLQPNAAPSKLQ